MIGVRFPSGLYVRYAASYIVWASENSRVHTLYTQKGGDFVAAVPTDAIIEFMAPTSVTLPEVIPSPQKAADIVIQGIRDRRFSSNSDARTMKRLKKAMSAFNARSGSWKT